MWNGDWSWGGMLLMALTMLVFWGGLVWLVVYLVRGSSASNQSEKQPTAIEQLEERFARGEIDADEFEERRRVLSRRAA